MRLSVLICLILASAICIHACPFAHLSADANPHRRLLQVPGGKGGNGGNGGVGAGNPNQGGNGQQPGGQAGQQQQPQQPQQPGNGNGNGNPGAGQNPGNPNGNGGGQQQPQQPQPVNNGAGGNNPLPPNNNGGPGQGGNGNGAGGNNPLPPNNNGGPGQGGNGNGNPNGAGGQGNGGPQNPPNNGGNGGGPQNPPNNGGNGNGGGPQNPPNNGANGNGGGPQGKQPFADGPQPFDPAQGKAANGPLPAQGKIAPGPKQAAPAPKAPAPKAPIRPRSCDVAALSANPQTYDPPGPSTQTTTDQTVKNIALGVLKKAVTLPNNTPNQNAPIGGFLRAAFHDAGTYNTSTGVGGANGSLRNEMTRAEHRGLNGTIARLNTIRDQINTLLPNNIKISFADLYQLAGAVAIEATNGPSVTPLIPVGRVDTNGQDPTVELPGENDPYDKIACLFLTNGYTLKEMYALNGAHTIGFKRTGGQQPRALDPTPFVFDTDVFAQMQQGQSVLASDNLLASMNPDIVSSYAGNSNAFFSDFATTYAKMSKMGAKWQNYGP